MQALRQPRRLVFWVVERVGVCLLKFGASGREFRAEAWRGFRLCDGPKLARWCWFGGEAF
jgi:hypothetical protein